LDRALADPYVVATRRRPVTRRAWPASSKGWKLRWSVSTPTPRTDQRGCWSTRPSPNVTPPTPRLGQRPSRAASAAEGRGVFPVLVTGLHCGNAGRSTFSPQPLSFGAEANEGEVADIGHEHRPQGGPDAGDGLDRGIARLSGHPAADHASKQIDLEVASDAVDEGCSGDADGSANPLKRLRWSTGRLRFT